MAKRVLAVTQIRHGVGNEEFVFEAGQVIDAAKFTKEDLESLYDAGAIRVEDTPEVTQTEAPAPAVAQPVEGDANAKGDND